MEILTVIFFGTFKFALTFPLAIYSLQFRFWETFLWINVGGILGVYFFAYLFAYLIRIWNRLFPGAAANRKNRERKVFCKRNRRIVAIKKKYGMTGIALLNPVILSIPIGVFLMVKYYPRNKAKLGYLITGQIVWSLLYCLFYYEIKGLWV